MMAIRNIRRILPGWVPLLPASLLMIWSFVAQVGFAAERPPEQAGFFIQVAGDVPGELLVKFRPGVSEDRIQQILSHIGGRSIGSIATTKLYRVRLHDRHQVAEAIAALQRFAEVEYAEPNAVESPPMPQ
jgi:hypothetical protein